MNRLFTGGVFGDAYKSAILKEACIQRGEGMFFNLHVFAEMTFEGHGFFVEGFAKTHGRYAFGEVAHRAEVRFKMTVDEDKFRRGGLAEAVLAREIESRRAGRHLSGNKSGLREGGDIRVFPFFLSAGWKTETLEGVDAEFAEGIDPFPRMARGLFKICQKTVTSFHQCGHPIT